jgi:hypothetical protein
MPDRIGENAHLVCRLVRPHATQFVGSVCGQQQQRRAGVMSLQHGRMQISHGTSTGGDNGHDPLRGGCEAQRCEAKAALV